jgi:uncharacterized protein YecT (DUF1311 family)
MKKKIGIFKMSGLTLIALLCSACGKLPDCSDSKTQDLLRNVYLGTEEGDTDAVSKMLSGFSVKTNTIQTVGKSEDPPKFKCKAIITVKPSEEYIKFLSDLKQRWVNGEAKILYSELEAGLSLKDLGIREQAFAGQSLFDSATMAYSFGPDLSGYATAVTYTSEFAIQDGKKRQLVTAQFDMVLNLTGVGITKMTLEQGIEEIKKNPKPLVVQPKNSELPAEAIMNPRLVGEPKNSESPVADVPTPSAAASSISKQESGSVDQAPKSPIASSQPATPTSSPSIPNQAEEEVFRPSFDCSKASNGAEKLICSNRELSKADVELSISYKLALSKGNSATVKESQRKWMKQRNACSDVECLMSFYRQRKNDLDKL